MTNNKQMQQSIQFYNKNSKFTKTTFIYFSIFCIYYYDKKVCLCMHIKSKTPNKLNFQFSIE